MTNTPETIAVFRTHEAKLDAELQRDRDLFSAQGISVKEPLQNPAAGMAGVSVCWHSLIL